jgi:hypothetical protein
MSIIRRANNQDAEPTYERGKSGATIRKVGGAATLGTLRTHFDPEHQRGERVVMAELGADKPDQGLLHGARPDSTQAFIATGRTEASHFTTPRVPNLIEDGTIGLPAGQARAAAAEQPITPAPHDTEE